MKNGLQPGSKRSLMIALIRQGVNTSVDIANSLDVPLGTVSSELYYLEKDMRAIRRVGTLTGKSRPRIVWGLRA